MRFNRLAAVSMVLLSYFGLSAAQADVCHKPVSVIGASNVLGFKKHIRENNKKHPKRRIDARTLVFEDSDPSTIDRLLCRKRCDPFAYLGRTIYRLRSEVKKGTISDAMDSIDSKVAIIFGGASSIPMEDKYLKRTLTYIVKRLKKDPDKKVYFIEMPYGAAGGKYYLGKKEGKKVFGVIQKSNIDRYNRFIRMVGADGVIPFRHAPWKKGKLHGIKMGSPQYFIDSVYRTIGKECLAQR